MMIAREPSAETRDARPLAGKASHAPQAPATVVSSDSGGACSGATSVGEVRDWADPLSRTLSRAVQERQHALAAGTTQALLHRVLEKFDTPSRASGQEGWGYVMKAGAKQLYLDTDDDTLYFKSQQSDERQWVLIQVQASETNDPRRDAGWFKAYDKVFPEKKRTIPPPQPAAVRPQVKPVEPPSPVALGLMQHTNHFQIRNLLGKVDELLGQSAIDVDVGEALQLSGDTVEVKFSVREKGKTQQVVAFVAHYHKNAKAAAVGSPNASKWHLKKWTNSWAHHDQNPPKNYPNLYKLIPKPNELGQPRNPQNNRELLYSPK